MDKYGYRPAPEKVEDLTKTGSKTLTCPICGKAISGEPPVCPDHGSLPYERDNAKRQK